MVFSEVKKIAHTTEQLGLAYARQSVIDIDPDVLNRRSRGKWITGYIELPEGYDVNNIDVSTVHLMGNLPDEVSAELEPSQSVY